MSTNASFLNRWVTSNACTSEKLPAFARVATHSSDVLACFLFSIVIEHGNFKLGTHVVTRYNFKISHKCFGMFCWNCGGINFIAWHSLQEVFITETAAPRCTCKIWAFDHPAFCLSTVWNTNYTMSGAKHTIRVRCIIEIGVATCAGKSSRF